MSVYVDWLCNHGWRMRGKLIQSCHLVADTPEELHAFAQSIGLKRKWAQGEDDPRRALHYDLTPGKRAQAVRAGVEELTKVNLREVFERAGMKWRADDVLE